MTGHDRPEYPATAITHGLIVATRDTSPFEAAGLNVINPWNVPH
jgi:predicted nucleic acid-binding protein